MATVRRSDLQDALDHAGEQGDVLEQLRLEDFTVSPVGTLRLQDAYRFDDIGAWAEWAKGELAEESEADRRRAVASFRGKDWAARALAWTPQTTPPIVIVERGDGTTVIGDGRGRVSYAIGMGWPALPAVFLRERERRAGRVAGRATGHPRPKPVVEGTLLPGPIDDFSVALWAFAELALERIAGMNLARVAYSGRPVFGPSGTAVGIVSLYSSPSRRDATAARAPLPSVQFWVQKNGDLWSRWPGYGPLKFVGNLLGAPCFQPQSELVRTAGLSVGPLRDRPEPRIWTHTHTGGGVITKTASFPMNGSHPAMIPCGTIDLGRGDHRPDQSNEVRLTRDRGCRRTR